MTLLELHRRNQVDTRTVVVMSDMLELGFDSPYMHVGQAPAVVNNQMGMVFAFSGFEEQLRGRLPTAIGLCLAE